MLSILRYMFFPALVCVLIFVGTCLLRPTDVPDLPAFLPWDKVVHFGMFFLLSAVSLIDYYLLHDKQPRLYRWLFWGLIVPIIYGGIIELLQKHVFVYRSGDIWDFVANVLGAICGTVCVLVGTKLFENKKKNLSL